MSAHVVCQFMCVHVQLCEHTHRIMAHRCVLSKYRQPFYGAQRGSRRNDGVLTGSSNL